MDDTKDDERSWENATWEGSRKSQLKAALKLSYAERFRALEEMSETSAWLANAKPVKPARETQ